MNYIRYKLTSIHHGLDEEIQLELKRRAPNWIRLLRLKKLRLAIKDRLHNLAPIRRHRLKPGRASLQSTSTGERRRTWRRLPLFATTTCPFPAAG